MSVADVDLNNLDVFEAGTPHEWFKTLREEDPVHRHAGAAGEEDFWCITKYADLKSISKDPGRFSSEEKGTLIRDPEPGTIEQLRMIMLNMDPPRHRNFRNLVNKAFTPRMVRSLEARVDRMVDDIIDSVIERGECEFVADLAAPLPMQVICEMMGVAEEDRKAVYNLGNAMVGFDDPEFDETRGTKAGESFHKKEPGNNEEMIKASAEMFGYAEKLKAEARANPSDNLASALLAAEIDGEKLSDIEFNSFFLILAIAGNETTRTVTTHGMYQLMAHPGERQRVLDDPTLLRSMIEEILRYDPAVHCFRRTAMADLELRGKEISRGDKMILWYPSVNRDEDVFDEADRFDVGRHPNDHLAFGIGEHFCLGANLARMELNKIFAALLERLPDLELAAPPRRLRSNFINGVKEMRVEFSPGPRKRN
ncbi:MAG: cytochrome P450 [Deltaproteobacteria bacterium]|nr:cytochrome P450 [Deltaproteobacteria bacterium]MBW2447927.1 cytochrome P450 [Deltaproteobacteria bacterium]